MDGLWSSPDLAAMLRLAALNREALGVTRGWLRAPLQVPRHCLQTDASRRCPTRPKLSCRGAAAVRRVGRWGWCMPLATSLAREKYFYPKGIEPSFWWYSA